MKCLGPGIGKKIKNKKKHLYDFFVTLFLICTITLQGCCDVIDSPAAVDVLNTPNGMSRMYPLVLALYFLDYVPVCKIKSGYYK